MPGSEIGCCFLEIQAHSLLNSKTVGDNDTHSVPQEMCLEEKIWLLKILEIIRMVYGEVSCCRAHCPQALRTPPSVC